MITKFNVGDTVYMPVYLEGVGYRGAGYVVRSITLSSSGEVYTLNTGDTCSVGSLHTKEEVLEIIKEENRQKAEALMNPKGDMVYMVDLKETKE